jgi:peptidoglycan/LPS O-acetylase OafA/YrhL
MAATTAEPQPTAAAAAEGAGSGAAGPRVSALDGLRALAALAVIALHTGIYSGQVASGWLGIGHPGPLSVVLSRLTVAVPVFFVLSGYLLFRPYARAGRDGSAAPGAGRYLWHRALRILPVYWAAALTALLLFTRSELGRPWPAARTFALLHIYQQGAIPRGLAQTWSLATECAFYALLPLIALALRPLLRRPSPAAALAALVAVEALTLAWTAVTHLPWAAGSTAAGLAVTWLPAYLGDFAAGMALALVSVRAEHGRPPKVLRALRRAPYAAWGVALLAYVVVSTPLTGSTARPQNAGQAIAEQLLDLVAAAALVAPTALVPGRGPSRLLSRRLPAYLGRISYGIFAWHMIVVEEWMDRTSTRAGHAHFAVLYPSAVLGAVALAALSHALLERPARRLRGLGGRRTPRDRPAAGSRPAPGTPFGPGAPARPAGAQDHAVQGAPAGGGRRHGGPTPDDRGDGDPTADDREDDGAPYAPVPGPTPGPGSGHVRAPGTGTGPAPGTAPAADPAPPDRPVHRGPVPNGPARTAGG